MKFLGEKMGGKKYGFVDGFYMSVSFI